MGKAFGVILKPEHNEKLKKLTRVLKTKQSKLIRFALNTIPEDQIVTYFLEKYPKTITRNPVYISVHVYDKEVEKLERLKEKIGWKSSVSGIIRVIIELLPDDHEKLKEQFERWLKNVEIPNRNNLNSL